MLCAAAKFPNLACSVLTISCGLPSICGATSHVLLWGGGGGGGEGGRAVERTEQHCYALLTSQSHLSDPFSQATYKERHKLTSVAQGYG